MLAGDTALCVGGLTGCVNDNSTGTETGNDNGNGNSDEPSDSEDCRASAPREVIDGSGLTRPIPLFKRPDTQR